ncbi:MAG: hypothetical protein ACAH83_20235 [Alphaproteobacteria bacterium]
MSTYTDQYKVFSENIVFAARALNYYLLIGKSASEDKKALDALNVTPRFWTDYNYMSVQTVIIFLGKIFDTRKDAHGIDKMLQSAEKNLHHFSKLALRERKGDFSGIDEYISKAQELSIEDIRAMQQQADKAKVLWAKIQPLRNKVFAHNEQALTVEKRSDLYKQVKYSDLTEVVQILLNIYHGLEQAELNGRVPDFSKDYDGPKGVAEQQIADLILRLKGDEEPSY